MLRYLFLALFLFATPLHAQTNLQQQVRSYRRANEQKILKEFINLLAIPNVAADNANIRLNAAQIIEMMKKEPAFIDAGVQLIVQLRHMERLADHATNVAEDVIFFTEAKIVRNRFDSEAFEELQRELHDEEEGEGSEG